MAISQNTAYSIQREIAPQEYSLRSAALTLFARNDKLGLRYNLGSINTSGIVQIAPIVAFLKKYLLPRK